MNATDINDALIARLESEIGNLKGALNLSRERAEDAEADLAEACRELALESQRADDAERERDDARGEAMGLEWELGQVRNAMDQHKAQIAPPAVPCGPTCLATAAEHADQQLTPLESPTAAKIAAELVAVMAENERRAAQPSSLAPAWKLDSQLIAPSVRNARPPAPTPTPPNSVQQAPLTIEQNHQYVLESFREAQNEAKVQFIAEWAAHQDFLQHQLDEQSEAYHAALERISPVGALASSVDADIPF